MSPNPSSPKSAAKPAKKPAEAVVKDIRRATRRHFSAEDKIRIVLEGLRGEESIAELCRREGIAQSRATNRGVSLLRAHTLAMHDHNNAATPTQVFCYRYPLSRTHLHRRHL